MLDTESRDSRSNPLAAVLKNVEHIKSAKYLKTTGCERMGEAGRVKAYNNVFRVLFELWI